MTKQYNRAEFAQRYAQVRRELGGGTTVVSSGGALLMLGLRKSTGHLELDVDEAVFNKHRTPTNTEPFGKVQIVNYASDVALHVLDPFRETQIVLGVRIYSINELIQQKQDLIDNPARKPEKIAQDRVDLKGLRDLLTRRPRSSSW